MMCSKLYKDQRGQSLTEFALVAPLLLLLVFGILDLGRYFYGHMQLQLAAQETVRLGGLGRTDADIRDFAQQYTGISDATMLTVTIAPAETERDSGDYVTVTLERPYRFVTPLAADIISEISSITASSTIRVE
jgi:Flp pilus assembly protein TadG